MIIQAEQKEQFAAIRPRLMFWRCQTVPKTIAMPSDDGFHVKIHQDIRSDTDSLVSSKQLETYQEEEKRGSTGRNQDERTNRR